MSSAFSAPVQPGPAAKGGVPFVKAAAYAAGAPESLFEGCEKWANLYPNKYADPSTRQFPIFDPQSTVASALTYRYLGGPEDHPVAGRIKEAASAFGVESAWEVLKEPEPEQRYCLPEQKKYPVSTPEEAVKAAEYLSHHSAKFSETDRVKFAENLLEIDDGMQALPFKQRCAVERYAGLGAPSDLCAAFEPRIKLAGSDRELLKAVAKAESEVRDGGCPYKAASLLKTLDASMGWKLPDPYDHLTSLTPTAAKSAADSLIPAASGKVYSASDVESVSPDAFSPWGPAAVATITKRASLLSGPESSAVEAVLIASGVTPVADWFDRVPSLTNPHNP